MEQTTKPVATRTTKAKLAATSAPALPPKLAEINKASIVEAGLAADVAPDRHQHRLGGGGARAPPEKRQRARRGSLFTARAAAYLHNALDPLRLMKVNEVAACLQIHPMTVWTWSRTGRFPKPVKLGPQIVCWRATDVAAWLDARAAETDP